MRCYHTIIKCNLQVRMIRSPHRPCGFLVDTSLPQAVTPLGSAHLHLHVHLHLPNLRLHLDVAPGPASIFKHFWRIYWSCRAQPQMGRGDQVGLVCDRGAGQYHIILWPQRDSSHCILHSDRSFSSILTMRNTRNTDKKEHPISATTS